MAEKTPEEHFAEAEAALARADRALGCSLWAMVIAGVAVLVVAVAAGVFVFALF